MRSQFFFALFLCAQGISSICFANPPYPYIPAANEPPIGGAMTSQDIADMVIQQLTPQTGRRPNDINSQIIAQARLEIQRRMDEEELAIAQVASRPLSERPLTPQEVTNLVIQQITESATGMHEELTNQVIEEASPAIAQLATNQARAQAPTVNFAPDQRRVTTKEYVYRADGKLSGFRDGQTQVEYYYDPLGRRVAKKVTQGFETYTQSYAYEGTSNRVLQAKAGDGTITTYIDGLRTNEHLGEVKNGIYKGYLTDHLGSVLNGDAAGVSHSFGLFGETGGASGITPYSNPNMYGFAGMQFDSESGTYATTYRNFAPSTGRWLSQEPSGRDGPNLYVYTFNNPLRYVDPSGLSSAAPESGGYAGYQSREEAAYKVLHDLDPVSRAADVEISGRIIQETDDTFSVSDVRSPGKYGGLVSFQVAADSCKIGNKEPTQVGGLHTHSNATIAHRGEVFSPEDMNLALKRRSPEYIITPGGVVKGYFPY